MNKCNEIKVFQKFFNQKYIFCKIPFIFCGCKYIKKTLLNPNIHLNKIPAKKERYIYSLLVEKLVQIINGEHYTCLYIHLSIDFCNFANLKQILSKVILHNSFSNNYGVQFQRNRAEMATILD